MDVDEAGTDHRAGGKIGPSDEFRALLAVKRIVVADLDDHARRRIDDHRPVAPRPELPESRRVEELTAQTEQNFGGG